MNQKSDNMQIGRETLKKTFSNILVKSKMYFSQIQKAMLWVDFKNPEKVFLSCN